MEIDIIKWFNEKQKAELEIKESILDFEHKTLSRDVFTSEDKLKPSIRKYILKRFDDIIKELKIDEKRIVSKYFYGSICGKYYNEHTDIDCQIMVKYEGENSQEKWEEDLKKLRTYIPGGYEYDESAGRHPINFYIANYAGQKFPASLDGVYDLEEDKWIQKNEVKINIGDRSCMEVAAGWVRKIEADLSELKRDCIDLRLYQENKKEIQNLVLGDRHLEGFINAKKEEIVFDLEAMSSTISALKEVRTKNQLDITDKFKTIKGEIKVTADNIHYFTGILAWKVLDSQGMLAYCARLREQYSQYRDGKLNRDKLVKKIAEMATPKNLWEH